MGANGIASPQIADQSENRMLAPTAIKDSTLPIDTSMMNDDQLVEAELNKLAWKSEAQI